MTSLENQLDKIHIRDLKVNLLIGVKDAERLEKREIILNVTAMLDLTKPCKSDDLDDTVNYHKLTTRIIEGISDHRFHLLEALADRIASICLEDSRIEMVRVIADKPGAIPSAYSAAVEIIRSQTG